MYLLFFRFAYSPLHPFVLGGAHQAAHSVSLVGPEKHANELAGRIPRLVLQNLRLVPLAFAGRTRQSQC